MCSTSPLGAVGIYVKAWVLISGAVLESARLGNFASRLCHICVEVFLWIGSPRPKYYCTLVGKAKSNNAPSSGLRGRDPRLHTHAMRAPASRPRSCRHPTTFHHCRHRAPLLEIRVHIRQSGRVLALQGYGIAGSLAATTEGTVTSRIY